MRLPIHLLPKIYEIHRLGIHMEGAKALVWNFYWYCGEVPFTAEEMVMVRKANRIMKAPIATNLTKIQIPHKSNTNHFRKMIDRMKEESLRSSANPADGAVDQKNAKGVCM